MISPSLSSIQRSMLKALFINLFLLFSFLEAASVANLKGSMSVEQGTLDYTVNLQLPPGIAGVVPKVSLSYSSNGGNGYLGVGWNLTGLSSISRCGSTYVEDGFNRSVRLDEKDHYCLDGQRLMPLAEGSSEYRTKIESYNRIKYDSSADTFKVWSKSGDIYEYGFTDDAKFIHEGKTVAWKVNKIRDALLDHNNDILFTYNTDNVISSISYATGINKINFNYDDQRLDKRKSNFKGQIIPQDKRLISIDILVNDNSIRQYNLSYLQQSNSRDQLKLDFIEECIGQDCLEPLSFAWETNNENNLTFNKISPPFTTDSSYKVKIADFNGDGISDIYKTRSEDDRIYIMNAQGGVEREIMVGVRAEYDDILLIDLNADGMVDIYERPPFRLKFPLGEMAHHRDRIWINDGQGNFIFGSHPGIDSKLKRLKFIDIDSDGDTDIYEMSSNGYDKIWKNNGSGIFTAQAGPQIRKIDFISEEESSSEEVFVNWNTKSRKADRDIALYDIDDDGDMDLFMTLPMEGEKKINEDFFLSKSVYLYRINIYINEGNGNFTLKPENKNITNKELSDATYNDIADVFHQFVELNGDGIPDILHIERKNRDKQSSYLYLSNGQEGWDTQELALAAPKKKIRLVDLDGDGITDIFHIYDGNNGMRINDGKGHFALDLNDQNISTSDQSYKRLDLIDINGDGVVDIMDKHNSFGPGFLTGTDTRRKAWLNDGMGEFTMQLHGISFSYNDEHYNAHYGDFNGDGLIDVFDTKRGIYLNSRKKEKIIAITDSFKNATKITYAPLTDSEVYTKGNDAGDKEMDIQTSAMVVASTSVGDGIGGEHVKSYHYSGLKHHIFRGSQGFKTVKVTDETTGAVTVAEYHQTYPLTGRVIKTQSFLGEEKLSESVAQIEVLSFSGTDWEVVDDLHSIQPAQAGQRHLIHNLSETSQSYMNDALLKTVSTSYEKYDNTYGNVEKMSVVTTGTAGTFTQTTTSTYDNIVDEEKWLLGRLETAKVKHEGYGAESISRTSSFAYNDQGMLESETVEPDDALSLTKTYAYDKYGNKLKETLSSGSLEGDRSTRYIYDDKGQFIQKVINDLGHEESRTYRQSDGKLLSVTGPNILTTRWEYNLWGQKEKELRADGTSTEWSYSYDSTQENGYYAITQTNTAGSTGTVYHDSFDRKVATKGIGFNNEEIFIKTTYNHKGEVAQKSSPHSMDDEVTYIVYTYDKYGRVIETQTPASDGQTAFTRVAYSGYAVTVTDAEGNTKTTTKNAMDKVTSIEESSSSMAYFYDAVGNLVKTVPNSNDAHAISMTYDILGNKISMIDPNMGTWSYTYNALGKLTSQTNAKGQTTTMHYDKLGRITSKTTLEGTSIWQYDNGTKALGKLTYESTHDSDFTKSYTYDGLGRLSSTFTTIEDKSYTESYVYNDKGQIETVTKLNNFQPNNFQLINVYKDNGYLEAIKSPAAQIKGFDFEHYANLISTQLDRALEYYKLYLEYQLKAEELRAKADQYQAIADANGDERDYFEGIAAQLRENAQQYQYYADLNQGYADEARATADKYQKKADKYKNYGWWGSQYADRYQSLADKYYTYAREYEALTQQYLQQAQLAISEAQYNEEQAQEHADIAAVNLQLAKETSEELKLVEEQLAYYKRLSEETAGARDISDAYNEVLSDAEHVYHYKVLSMDSYGRVTKSLSGNGLINTDSFEHSGAMRTSHTGFYGDNEIRDLSYEYDKTYNVTTRRDTYLGVTSHYVYDSLSRIESAQFVFDEGQGVTGLDAMSYEYDAYGNIKNKSDIGDYTYSQTNPNRLMSTYSSETDVQKTFAYDANGNMINNNGIIIEYNSANKATMIKDGSTVIHFDYDMNQKRYKKTQGNTTTHYLGKGYEYIQNGDGSTAQRHLIYANGKVVAINTNSYEAHDATTAIPSIRYLHYDSLGSVDTITDNRGIVLERRAYKPFGEQLEVYKKEDAGFTTNRGYTGHEHLEGTKLIHMNARLYDPTLGRFLSADPIIQDPYDTQAFNRYSYVRNNPLKYTDPSGHSWFSKLIKIIIVVILVAYTAGAVLSALGHSFASAAAGLVSGSGVAGSTALIASGMAAGFVGGVVGGLLNGASLNQALISGVQGAIFGAITAGASSVIGNITNATLRAISHGVVRGIIARAQGGNFGAGFMSSFASSILQPVGEVLAKGNYYARTFFSAAVGGTVSAIGGGKFANGAVTSAFQFMYNDWLHFNGKNLKHYDDNGKLLKVYQATSGRSGTTGEDQRLRNVGPLPEGEYTINPKEISHVHGWAYFKRWLSPLARLKMQLADWGNYRVALHPSEGTNTYNRDGFFLHGGISSGSAGCIDVGIYDGMLFGGFNALQDHQGSITLTVRYGQ